MTLRNINEMKRLMANVRGDITATGQRAKNMQEFVESIGVYTNVNPLTSTKHLDQTNKVVSGITEAFDSGFKGQGIGGHRSVYREISQKYTMGYVTRMGDDMKDQLRGILAKNLDKGLGWQETARDMTKNVDGMTRKRAVLIARTESVRAKNLGQWAEHKEMGYKYFEVLPHSTACKRCKKAYIGVVFPMTGKFTVMLPPLHPNCRCAARFYKSVPAGYKVVRQVPKEFMPGPKPKPQPKAPKPKPEEGPIDGPLKKVYQGPELRPEDKQWLQAKNADELQYALKFNTDRPVHGVVTKDGKVHYVTKGPDYDIDAFFKAQMKTKSQYEVHNTLRDRNDIDFDVITDAMSRWIKARPILKEAGLKPAVIKNEQRIFMVTPHSTRVIQPTNISKIQKFLKTYKDNPGEALQGYYLRAKNTELRKLNALPEAEKQKWLKEIGGQDGFDEWVWTKAINNASDDLGIWTRVFTNDMKISKYGSSHDFWSFKAMRDIPYEQELARRAELAKKQLEKEKKDLKISQKELDKLPPRFQEILKVNEFRNYSSYPDNVRKAARDNDMWVYREQQYGEDHDFIYIFWDRAAKTEVRWYENAESNAMRRYNVQLTELLKEYKKTPMALRKSTRWLNLQNSETGSVLGNALYGSNRVNIFTDHSCLFSSGAGSSTDKSFRVVLDHEMGHCFDYHKLDVIAEDTAFRFAQQRRYYSSMLNQDYFKAVQKDIKYLQDHYEDRLIDLTWGPHSFYHTLRPSRSDGIPQHLGLENQDLIKKYAVSGYARNCVEGSGLTENWADGVAMALNQPRKFKKYFPNQYKFLKREIKHFTDMNPSYINERGIME